jgi:hypothetical protein
VAGSRISRGKVIRTALRALVLAIPLAGAAFLPAEAARKLPDFDPIQSGRADVLAFKTYGKNLRITASADIVRASLRGFPDVTFNDHGYAERIMIRTPVRSGSVAADFSLGCGG